MIKILAIGAIFAVAIWLGRGYAAFCDRRIGEIRGICDLLLHLEEKICHSMSFGAELYRDFTNEFLLRSGFLDCIKDSENSTEACEKLSLPKEIKDKIIAFFSSFGRGYFDEEIGRLRRGREELLADCERLSESMEKNKRVVNALLFGAFASLGIIMM